MRVSPEMQLAWTQYWNTGHFDSLPEDRAAGRLASLDAAWNEFFSQLPDEATLLDLATGGGDVIRRALGLGRQFRVTGIDLADLSAVDASLKAPEVVLVGNTDLSTLPFADGVFSGATSQFGIEYADMPAATREVVRVLVRGGRGHFVLHHAASAITQGVADNLAADRSVFAGSNVFQLGRALFELRRSHAPRIEITEAEAAFQTAVSMLQSRLRAERAFGPARNVVAFLTRLVAVPDAISAEEALHRLNVVDEEMQARTLRKVAQIDAALDRAGVDRLAASLTSAGAIVSAPRELRYPGGRLLGWSLSFSK